MVFILEDIAKIEADRMTEGMVVENFTHIQRSNDVFGDPRTVREINRIMEWYVQAAQYYVWNSDIHDVLGVFADAFLNAGLWGNKNVPEKRIEVCIKYGLLGSVIYLEDEGKGFDYKTQVEKLQRGEKHNFSRNGGGLRKFHRSHLHVSFHDCGNKISIATRISSEEELDRFSMR
ncbi:ATP-binding protein [Candidatus Woesearchaeota archaeon]|nr:ATP-binding protein [Candidatus Woesearchaeota archaeon]